MSLGLFEGEKVGLIGRNGAGKSTLFRILSGDEAPDTGEVVVTQGLRISRLSQEPHFQPGATVQEALEAALADHAALLARHQEIHGALHGSSPEAETRLHDELQHIEHQLDRWGWDLMPRLKAGATAWGLQDLDAEVESLSGGWRKRVALAQAWLKEPDILILDEPTNHLDPDQVERLEAWLQAFQGALLLITHDRHLLDAVVDRMLELEEGALRSYEGGYSDYLLEKSDREFRESRLTEHMQNRLRREMAWLRRGAKARTRKSKLRIQDVLDLKDTVGDRTRLETRQDLTFAVGGNRSDALIRTEQVCFSYPGGAELLGGIDLCLQRGMRIALLGPNGSGKSTLLKVLLGELPTTSGEVFSHPKIAVTAISQGRGELDGQRSILDNLADRAAVVQVGGGTSLAHVYLTRFGFPVDQQARRADTLSGGERNRLLLAKAMLSPADLLVLDEPTNDLDIPTLQNLEEALLGFEGSLLVVSHDRFFLDQVATHTLAWNEADLPRWELYEGPPSTVRSLRAARAASKAPIQATASREQPRTGPAKVKKPGLTQKEQRQLAEIEQAMADLQERITALDHLLADPTAFLRPDSPGHQALRDREAAHGELEACEVAWLELEEKRSQL
ncbi:MAG TPA: ABC-F family ATP-binding cassette domain-containing protein [Geothrix sp.]|nr:ABC-F family ATP-binding cassette domain-containing protein [Geothrix sp.]